MNAALDSTIGDVVDELQLATSRIMSLLTVLNRHVEDHVAAQNGWGIDEALAIDYAIQRVVGDIEEQATRLAGLRVP